VTTGDRDYWRKRCELAEAEIKRQRVLLERAKDWWGNDYAGMHVRNDIMAEFGIATLPINAQNYPRLYAAEKGHGPP
jgi:hypothetical protein